MKNISSILTLGLIIFSACSPTGATSVTPAPVSTATAMPILPTPSSPGDPVVWDTLQVTLDQLEITQDYVTDFDSSRVPPDGYKFLWVHVRLRNIGQVEMDVPLLENFSILYAAAELKPTYGHRAEYADYSALDPVIFPDQELDGWLRFDIPVAAELIDLRFVFIPESAQVGVSYNSPNYPYAINKPTYVWNCQQ